MIEQFFQKYLKQYQPFKPYWNYEDGCVLLGCIRMFQATGAACYAEFVLRYLSTRVEQDGSIPTYPVDFRSLDSFQCSKSLFFAYDLTREPRYGKALAWQAAQLGTHPRTKSGLCWHKQIYREQVWIDGVYMSAPFLAEYARRSDDSALYDEIARAFRFVIEKMRDPETGLYYHALDEAGAQEWADPQTGLSQSHWLRGEGWFLMALTDTLACLPESETSLHRLLSDALRDAVTALLPYHAENGLFYQVIDRADLSRNYTETSGSLMTAYALMRGAELHILPDEMFLLGAEILECVKREKLDETGLHDICSAAGLGGANKRDGSAAYYLSEPVVSDDPKGVGVLMMAEAVRIRSQHPVSAMHTAISF